MEECPKEPNYIFGITLIGRKNENQIVCVRTCVYVRVRVCMCACVYVCGGSVWGECVHTLWRMLSSVMIFCCSSGVAPMGMILTAMMVLEGVCSERYTVPLVPWPSISRYCSS